jgi:hypothetical protein
VALFTSLPLLQDGVLTIGANPAFSSPPPLPLGLVLLADSQLTMLLSPSGVLEEAALGSPVLEEAAPEEAAPEEAGQRYQ